MRPIAAEPVALTFLALWFGLAGSAQFAFRRRNCAD
jgi:hypothetical protein